MERMNETQRMCDDMLAHAREKERLILAKVDEMDRQGASMRNNSMLSRMSSGMRSQVSPREPCTCSMPAACSSPYSAASCNSKVPFYMHWAALCMTAVLEYGRSHERALCMAASKLPDFQGRLS